MDEERKQVEKDIKCVLVTVKGGVNVKDLQRDYKALLGETMPFRKFGYSSLIEFLESINDIYIFNKGGDVFVDAAPSGNTAHISKLVSHQKTAKKRVVKKVNRPNKPFVPKLQLNSFGYNTAPKPSSSFNGSQNYRHDSKPIKPLMKAGVYSEMTKSTFNSVPYRKPPSPPLRNYDKPLEPQKSVPINVSNGKAPLLTTPWGPGEIVRARLANSKEPPMKTEEPLIPKLPKTVSSIPYISQIQNVQSARLVPPLQPLIISPKAPSEPIKLTDSRDELRCFTTKYNLPEPRYKILPTKNKNIYAHVVVGSHKFSSYPNDARSEEEAQRLAATEALTSLRRDMRQDLDETVGKDMIEMRIIKMVTGHETGLVSHEIDLSYSKIYNERLPKDWLEIIKDCSSITIEKGVGVFILFPYKPPTKHTSPVPFKYQIDEIPEVDYPDEALFPIFVTYVDSAISVWARLGDDCNSDAFEAMASEMTEYYVINKDKYKTNSVQVGKYYSIFEGDYWHRVKCEIFDASNNTATVFFIDLGDIDCIDCSKLYTLADKYYTIPAQALRFLVSDIEEWAECEKVTEIIEKHLLDKPYMWAEMSNVGNDDQEMIRSVIFHQIKDETSDTIINDAIAEELMDYAKVKLPRLLATEGLKEAYMTHVSKKGEVYVQVQSDSLKLFMSLYNRLLKTGFNQADFQKGISDVDLDMLYFVKNNSDDMWYRARIKSYIQMSTSENAVRVFLIDYGGTIIVNAKDLIPLRNISKYLNEFPEQAIQVDLNNISPKILIERTSRFKKLAEGALLMKVVKPATFALPAIVELFQRIQPNNIIASINNNLLLEIELLSQNGEQNNNNIKKRVEVRNRAKMTKCELPVRGNAHSKYLKAPKVPIHFDAKKNDAYFDVHIALTANPGNFVVQPYASQKSLNEMKNRLQEVYAQSQDYFPTLNAIKEGDLCAAKHKGEWYRTCIKNIINENQVTVYVCDYGSIAPCSMEDLRPLKDEFFELPYQAIRARLAGVQPMNMDWSVADCIFFRELVADRNLVSIVLSCVLDTNSSDEIILNLELIDTSNPDKDVHINEVLISNRHAVAVDSQCQ